MIDVDALSWGPCLPLVDRDGRVRPACRYDLATTDLRELAALTPDDAVGVGVLARAAGLLVLDVEHERKGRGDGPATMRELQVALGPLPATRTHRTRSGGWHLVFRDPGGVRSAQGELRGAATGARAVDVIAGNQVLRWPPTLGYSVLRRLPAAELPAAWVLALRDPPEAERPPREPVPEDRRRRYALAALDRNCEALAASSSLRNCNLNAVAYRLGRMCPPLSREEVEGDLLLACEANGAVREHGRRACLGSIKRGLDAGERAPLSLVG